jgi:hypothetical protein
VLANGNNATSPPLNLEEALIPQQRRPVNKSTANRAVKLQLNIPLDYDE